ncbi:cyclin-like protein [Saccharata proteae CBS 121410]|uniref:Cyclin-like protein n=1 Tax=Saccharata proteae CBS 121410 TaxID=1314787 RepID=A0A9P4LUW3_9PEZI|nr:cyclin-like protein [Saccharata proteae CBS 121410]
MHLSEDEIYRTSTQFRAWSFTPEKLRSIRENTNKLAAERVSQSIARHKPDAGPVDCLTPEEEQVIVVRYCLAKEPVRGTRQEFPFVVAATAIQFLKRFYLYNSVMVYDPRQIVPSALYFAIKAESWKVVASEFIECMKGKFPMVDTVDKLLAPEYLIMQSLRYNISVRHPLRGLDGGHMELIAMAKGKAALLPWLGKTASEMQQEMLRLPPKGPGHTHEQSEQGLLKREAESYYDTDYYVRSTALYTDAYFHYTPPQIWLAALLLADEPLALFYLDTKFPRSDDLSPLKEKVLSTIRACAVMLKSWSPVPKEEMTLLEKKRDACADPEKADLVTLNRAQKREGTQDGLDENVAKKRKLEREKHEKQADTFWGPEISKG